MLEGSDEEEADEPSGQEETLTVARNGTEAGGSGTPVDSESIEDQKMAWLQAEGPDKPKGVPLRCLLCKNKLLVSCGMSLSRKRETFRSTHVFGCLLTYGCVCRCVSAASDQ